MKRGRKAKAKTGTEKKVKGKESPVKKRTPRVSLYFAVLVYVNITNLTT